MKFTHRFLFYSCSIVFSLNLANAVEVVQCPQITKDRYPVLMYIEQMKDRNDLYVASSQDSFVYKEKIFSGKKLEVSRLDDTIFLLTTQNNGNEGKVYTLDLSMGTIRFLEENTNIQLLHTSPERKKAMLMRIDKRLPEIILKELDFEIQEIREVVRLDKEILGDMFDGPESVKLSPDLKHLAFSKRNDPSGSVSIPRTHTIKMMDLSSGEIKDLDKEVMMDISPISSNLLEFPAMEWFDEDEILYQSIVPLKNDERPFFDTRIHLLKTIHIHEGTQQERFRKEMRMKAGSLGDHLFLDPFKKQIVYRNEWIINTDNWTLSEILEPYQIERDYESQRSTIYFKKNKIYTGDMNCIDHILSQSGDNFAYTVRPWETFQPFLYAQMKGELKPLLIDGCQCYSIKSRAWIEEKGSQTAVNHWRSMRFNKTAGMD